MCELGEGREDNILKYLGRLSNWIKANLIERGEVQIKHKLREGVRV